MGMTKPNFHFGRFFFPKILLNQLFFNQNLKILAENFWK